MGMDTGGALPHHGLLSLLELHEASQDSKLINNGEFLTSLCSYTTIPKAPRGTTIDCHHSQYLNIVHVDIAFGDRASIKGFKYALIFVDRATHYNWTFGLKSLQHDDILDDGHVDHRGLYDHHIV
jgi:hypothetical protein